MDIRTFLQPKTGNRETKNSNSNSRAGDGDGSSIGCNLADEVAEKSNSSSSKSSTNNNFGSGKLY